MTKVKICGLRREVDIEYANELRPEYIGFIFAPKSRRFVDYEKAAELKALLDKNIKAVGVFVNEEIDNILKLVENETIDIIQLHGSEEEEYIKVLKTKTDKVIIKAFRIDTKDDILVAGASSADYILLDSGNGGTGTSFDWSLINDIKRPYFLAGGLGIENVAHAIAKFHPFAVDVSSKVETEGFKDKDKMAAFVEACRRS